MAPASIPRPRPGPLVAKARVLLRQNDSVLLRSRSISGLEAPPVSEMMVGKGIQEAARALNLMVPKVHRVFLSSLRNSLCIDGYFFCHAGVRPSIPLDRQSEDDLFWIRDEFLTSENDFGKMVIHGHSPHEWPEVKRNRVNIDTGAFATGRLTCLVIDDGRGRFLFTA